MGGYHPNNIDPRPKRRQDRDNPYTIFTIIRGTSLQKGLRNTSRSKIIQNF